MVRGRNVTDKELRRLRSHGLAFDEMSDEDLSHSNCEDIRDMDAKMAGSGLYSLGSLLSGNGDAAFMIDLMKAQIRQQWVIVRQNEQIIRLLKGLADNSDVADTKSPVGDTMLRIPAEVSEGAFVAIGDELVFRGTMLMKDGVIASKLTPSQRDTVIKAMSSGGSRIVVSDVSDSSMIISVIR